MLLLLLLLLKRPIERLTSRMGRHCDWAKLIRLALVSAALSLIVAHIWVTTAQVRGGVCHLIGLPPPPQDEAAACGDDRKASHLVVFLVGLYVNVNILTAVGFVCSSDSLVAVGLGQALFLDDFD